MPIQDFDRYRRLAYGVGGGTLLVAGLKRRSMGGAVMTLAGGWLVYRAIAGRPSAGPDVETPQREPPVPPEATRTTQSVTIGKPAEELYDLWRDPETMTRVFGDFVDVRASSRNRHHWTIETPLDGSLSWETRVVEERPGESIRWESRGDGPVSMTGLVRFQPAPADRGTEVTLEVDLEPPGGTLGERIAARLGVVPETATETALNRFKSLAETGEIPTLEGNASARGTGDLL